MAAAAGTALPQTTSATATGVPRRALGRTGEMLSIVCIGGWHIGAVPERNEAIRIMHAAIDEGVNFFDNAWDYHDGRSEEWMGDALATNAPGRLEGSRQESRATVPGCVRGRERQDNARG